MSKQTVYIYLILAMLGLGLLSSMGCSAPKPHYILINDDGSLDTIPQGKDSIDMLIDSIKTQGYRRMVIDSTGNPREIVDTAEKD